MNMESTFRIHGTALKFLRIINDYSAGDVAKALDCSYSLISHIESSKAQMTPRDTQKLLRLFGITEEQAINFMMVVEEAKGVYKNDERN